MLRALYKLIFFRILGWRIEGQLPTEKKYIIVVAPHTSSFDFMLGVFSRRILQFDPKFIGKKELFKFPFGYFFKWMGGYPVDRSKKTNFVDSIAAIFDEKDEFIITISPEGTRNYNPDWKTGFYYIAKKANIPVLKVGFDYSQKRVVLAQAEYVPQDVNQCINAYKKYFSQFKGKHPENGVLWEE